MFFHHESLIASNRDVAEQSLPNGKFRQHKHRQGQYYVEDQLEHLELVVFQLELAPANIIQHIELNLLHQVDVLY